MFHPEKHMLIHFTCITYYLTIFPFTSIFCLLFLCKVKNETQAPADPPNHIRLLIKKKPKSFIAFAACGWLVASVDRQLAARRSSKPHSYGRREQTVKFFDQQIIS